VIEQQKVEIGTRYDRSVSATCKPRPTRIVRSCDLGDGKSGHFSAASSGSRVAVSRHLLRLSFDGPIDALRISFAFVFVFVYAVKIKFHGSSFFLASS